MTCQACKYSYVKHAYVTYPNDINTTISTHNTTPTPHNTNTALMHHPAAVEAALRHEKRRQCAHTASRPYSAARRASVSGSARSALDKVPGAVQKATSLASYNRRFYVVYTSTQFNRDGPMSHSLGCIDWHQRHARVLSALSSDCPVYGAFVAAVVTMVSLRA